MERKHNKIWIRNAKTEDAKQLCNWWNDGSIMEHAGFPNGLGTTVHEVAAQIEKESDETTRRHIILFDDVHTTGSTMHECRTVLEAAGAEEVCLVSSAFVYHKKKEWI